MASWPVNVGGTGEGLIANSSVGKVGNCSIYLVVSDVNLLNHDGDTIYCSKSVECRRGIIATSACTTLLNVVLGKR